MLSTIFRTLKSKKGSLLAYSLTGVAFIWMYVAIFPTFQKESGSFKDIIGSMPEAMMEAFGISAELFVNLKLESFLGTEQFSLVWPIMVIALMVGFAGSQLAGETEKKTIDILLSQPISRYKLFLSKYIAGVIGFIIFMIASIFSVIPFANIYNIEYQLSSYFSIFFLGLLFGLAVYGIALLFSSLFTEKSKVSLIASGVVIIMYVMNIVALLIESLEPMKYASLFYYFDTADALSKNEISGLSILAFLVIIISTTTLAAYIFNKRDISV